MVFQKAEIGVHCQTKTRTTEIVKAITKMPQYMRMRRNWTIGKIRNRNRRLPIMCVRRYKIDGRRKGVAHGILDARHSKSIRKLESIVVLEIGA